ncbi:Adenylate cyclase domain-containing protein [Azotobacter vinelandii CA]|uniref:Adenylate cyclase domain-containing protein n=2 Tax=Azotobacter vinelandii TaxID=354 RepID=C1DJF5_AZOVD|nr:CYTH domain-containing protein [Azotobacter vinelandii]ACO76740.1 Adenylate cyclase domain-containing protein [Azotobacter vinelandii DJ]AGK17281.1 Adenylate cyclase domain-containing protein [Azotobacter vinelandii CA]AGK19332.1 Adenylate cyclase domain-containing protein [Azotobacter vinelandii CA6]WKN22499.1 CYTH domain-containing protein [Azotobacter vinelandii]SFX81156.1 adenylate cyclase [Azotobacter vinelandii]
MAKETEIKLRVSRTTLAALREHPLLNARSEGGWQRHELLNQYYDTPARDLARARVALRLRRDGGQCIQTLKSRGQSVAGLSERNEWDWYLEAPVLDPALLDDQCWPAELAGLDKGTLLPIFSTDFVREKADLVWQRDGRRVAVEAALDLGKVVAGPREEEICELELELREGEPAALLELALALAADLPLMPCDISKAERGYRLFDPASYALVLPAPIPDAELPLDEAFAPLAWHLLGCSQRLAEQYRFNGHWKLLEQWLAQLIDLRALLGSLGQAAPRAGSSALRGALDALIGDWRPQLVAGRDDEAVRQAAPARFAAELERPRWGLFSLEASRWLLTRAWTERRNAAGQRQGAAPLGRWLTHLLADEARALSLPRCQQQPENLTEQLPRLERVLVWLRLARNVLEMPEPDRLYGELAKLGELAARPLDDDLREQRAAQAQIVATLKPWKALLK